MKKNELTIRYASIDLVKWLAIIAMTIDHIRYVFPQFQLECIAVGRMAFIMFAMALAFNLNQIFENKKYESLFTYFTYLVIFCFLSEIPYQLLSMGHTFGTYNIMFTLLLGFLAISAFNSFKAQGFNIFLLLAVLYLALFLNNNIQYGFLGVLLILVFYLMLWAKNPHIKTICGVLATVLACLCNLQYYVDIIAQLGFGSLWVTSMLAGCVFGSLLGLFLVMNKSIMIGLGVKPVGKWAWWFYPLHQLVFYGLYLIIN